MFSIKASRASSFHSPARRISRCKRRNPVATHRSDGEDRERVRAAVFYDMGNVYYDSYDFKLDEFNADVGMGLRLNLPIGPLRFDYGIPVHDSNDLGGGGRFNFTVGYQREF